MAQNQECLNHGHPHSTTISELNHTEPRYDVGELENVHNGAWHGHARTYCASYAIRIPLHDGKITILGCHISAPNQHCGLPEASYYKATYRVI